MKPILVGIASAIIIANSIVLPIALSFALLRLALYITKDTNDGVCATPATLTRLCTVIFASTSPAVDYTARIPEDKCGTCMQAGQTSITMNKQYDYHIASNDATGQGTCTRLAHALLDYLPAIALCSNVLLMYALIEIVFAAWYWYKVREYQALTQPPRTSIMQIQNTFRSLHEQFPAKLAECIVGWFPNCTSIAEIGRENMLDWLCWAFFLCDSRQVLESSSVDGLEHKVELLFDDSKSIHTPIKFAQKVIRHLLPLSYSILHREPNYSVCSESQATRRHNPITDPPGVLEPEDLQYPVIRRQIILDLLDDIEKRANHRFVPHRTAATPIRLNLDPVVVYHRPLFYYAVGL